MADARIIVFQRKMVKHVLLRKPAGAERRYFRVIAGVDARGDIRRKNRFAVGGE